MGGMRTPEWASRAGRRLGRDRPRRVLLLAASLVLVASALAFALSFLRPSPLAESSAAVIAPLMVWLLCVWFPLVLIWMARVGEGRPQWYFGLSVSRIASIAPLHFFTFGHSIYVGVRAGSWSLRERSGAYYKQHRDGPLVEITRQEFLTLRTLELRLFTGVIAYLAAVAVLILTDRPARRAASEHGLAAAS